MAQDEAVPVGIDDGDSPSVPVGITRWHLLAAGFKDPADGILVKDPADVEHEKVFFRRSRQRFPVQVINQLQVPGRFRPPKHQKRMPTFDSRPGPVQHRETEAVNPEALGSREVAAWAGDTEMASWVRQQGNSIPPRPSPRLGADPEGPRNSTPLVMEGARVLEAATQMADR